MIRTCNIHNKDSPYVVSYWSVRFQYKQRRCYSMLLNSDIEHYCSEVKGQMYDRVF